MAKARPHGSLSNFAHLELVSERLGARDLRGGCAGRCVLLSSELNVRRQRAGTRATEIGRERRRRQLRADVSIGRSSARGRIAVRRALSERTQRGRAVSCHQRFVLHLTRTAKSHQYNTVFGSTKNKLSNAPFRVRSGRRRRGRLARAPARIAVRGRVGREGRHFRRITFGTD